MDDGLWGRPGGKRRSLSPASQWHVAWGREYDPVVPRGRPPPTEVGETSYTAYGKGGVYEGITVGESTPAPLDGHHIHLTRDISEPIGASVNRMYVQKVLSGSAAERAGLQVGMQIVAVNGRTVRSVQELAGMMRELGDCVLTIAPESMMLTRGGVTPLHRPERRHFEPTGSTGYESSPARREGKRMTQGPPDESTSPPPLGRPPPRANERSEEDEGSVRVSRRRMGYGCPTPPRERGGGRAHSQPPPSPAESPRGRRTGYEFGPSPECTPSRRRQVPFPDSGVESPCVHGRRKVAPSPLDTLPAVDDLGHHPRPEFDPPPLPTPRSRSMRRAGVCSPSPSSSPMAWADDTSSSPHDAQLRPQGRRRFPSRDSLVTLRHDG
eukprot:Sspe_Gene.105361::Locus_82408_Transcript_1_1_Confidence_1.000_Length_1227::g.105361::m.105361